MIFFLYKSIFYDYAHHGKALDDAKTASTATVHPRRFLAENVAECEIRLNYLVEISMQAIPIVIIDFSADGSIIRIQIHNLATPLIYLTCRRYLLFINIERSENGSKSVSKTVSQEEFLM